LALHPDRANEQHYEVPPAFFQKILGPWMKYSCGLWDEGVENLADAEERMLALTCATRKALGNQDTGGSQSAVAGHPFRHRVGVLFPLEAHGS